MRKTPATVGNRKDVKIVVPLKDLSNFSRTLEMSLISCEINFILTWSEICVISSGTWKTKFAIADTKLYVTIVTLLTQGNAKLLQQLNSGFNPNLGGLFMGLFWGGSGKEGVV